MSESHKRCKKETARRKDAIEFISKSVFLHDSSHSKKLQIPDLIYGNHQKVKITLSTLMTLSH